MSAHLERDRELVQRVLAAGQLDSDDPTGDKLRQAATSVAWVDWKARRPRGGWDAASFREWSGSEWARARDRCRDCPRRAALEYARELIAHAAPTTTTKV